MSKLGIEGFATLVRLRVQDMLGSAYDVEVIVTEKNNDTKRTGLSIRLMNDAENKKLTIVVYLDKYLSTYLDGKTSIKEVADDVIHEYKSGFLTYQNDSTIRETGELVYDFESVKDKIIYNLINTGMNRQRLETIPHVDFLNLSLIFRVLVDINEQESIGAITITNELVEHWGVNTDVLMSYAKENTEKILPPKIRTMSSVMAELTGQPESMFSNDNETFVVSNTTGVNGAVCMLYNDLLKNFANKLNKDLIILPSSIHEILVVPFEEEESFEVFSNMVQDVNDTAVPSEEVLSDVAYKYCRSVGEIQFIK